MNPFIFVYGTLKRGHKNPVARHFHLHAEWIGTGKFAGTIKHLGEYPAAIFDPAAESFVHGEIFKMNDPFSLLKILDHYEGIGPEFPLPHEYIRATCPVTMEGKTIDCWVYLFNRN
ncbi:MAG: gamma-glutamylcyclotransferase family protein [Saprospiraceae bacterium]